jgi:hypothetical protein
MLKTKLKDLALSETCKDTNSKRPRLNTFEFMPPQRIKLYSIPTKVKLPAKL